MYKYEDILEDMKIKYRGHSGCEVPEMSDLDIRMKVLAGEIYNNEVQLEFIKRQIFASTATGEYLDYHAADRGIERKSAEKATGEVRFWINEEAAQPITIPEGTIVSTEGARPVRFVTNSEAVLEIGNAVTVSCTAQEGGISGNVGAHTINTIVTNVVGIDGVMNIWPFKGGSDTESDDSLRRRVLETYKSVSNGTNKAYYEKLAKSVEGVYSVNVVPRGSGVGTVDVYIACQNAEAPLALVNKVRELISSKRELNVNVEVFTAEVHGYTAGIEVVLEDGYDLETVRQNIIESVGAYIDTLEVGDSIMEHPLSSAIINSEGVVDFEYINIYPSTYYASEDTYLILNDVVVEEASD